jgi:hypothetical protein
MERVPSPNERCPWPVGRIVACLLAGLSGAIALGLVGLVVGVSYGAKYDVEFNGMRGYEATGQIGAILGFVAGGALSALFCFLVHRRR